LTEGQAPKEEAKAEPTPTTQASTTPAASVTIDVSELAAIRKELEDVRREAASRRVKAKEAEAERAKALEEQGQFKALAESLKARVSELEPLEALAKRWQDFEAAEGKRIAQAKESLPPHWQAALDAAANLDGKQAILRAYDAERSSTKPAPPPAPAGGAPAAPTARERDWSAVAHDRGALRKAIAEDPEGWEKFSQGMTTATRPVTTFDRLFSRKK
jgi:hypothetical protein